jgi:hypothetical protein
MRNKLFTPGLLSRISASLFEIFRDYLRAICRVFIGFGYYSFWIFLSLSGIHSTWFVLRKLCEDRYFYGGKCNCEMSIACRHLQCSLGYYLVETSDGFVPCTAITSLVWSRLRVTIAGASGSREARCTASTATCFYRLVIHAGGIRVCRPNLVGKSEMARPESSFLPETFIETTQPFAENIEPLMLALTISPVRIKSGTRSAVEIST